MGAANCGQPGADSGSTETRLPTWIILDNEVNVEEEDRENATTAEGNTNSGRRFKVSLFVADPPRLSHFCVHFPILESGYDSGSLARVLHAEDNLALISIKQSSRAAAPSTYSHTAYYSTLQPNMPSGPEYFFYRAAGRGRRPSIQPLPAEVNTYLGGVQLFIHVGFLPCGDDGSYVLAALSHTDAYCRENELHVFRSTRHTWNKSVLENRRHRLRKVVKVITIGAGELGFVDLLKGIIVCDVLSNNPTGRFIPLPKLLPGNRPDNTYNNEVHPARPFRDVAVYAGGLIKCVEVEPLSRITIHKVPRVATKRRVIPERLPDDVSNIDELHDSDLIRDPVDVEEVEMEEEETYQYLGWRVIVWSRTPSSTSWRKECLIQVDDVIAQANPTHASLLGQLGGSRAPSLTMKHLRLSYPSLSVDDSNALYLTTKVQPLSEVRPSRDGVMCVIKVDMGKKTLEEISPLLAERQHTNLNYISCALFKNTDSDPSRNRHSSPQAKEESDT